MCFTSGATEFEMRWSEQACRNAFSALDSLPAENVQCTLTIRQEPHTVTQTLNRALAHYAQHIGQFLFLAKHCALRDGRRSVFREANPKITKPVTPRDSVAALSTPKPDPYEPTGGPPGIRRLGHAKKYA
jgi:hypothetical protein